MNSSRKATGRPQTKLRKGNVFTPVCDSVHGGGGMRGGGGACVARGACMVGGMHGKGACIAGDVHGRGGHAWQKRRPLQRTGRILLECILVWDFVAFPIHTDNCV